MGIINKNGIDDLISLRDAKNNMNNKIDLSACVVGNGFINVYDEVCFLSEINHDNEFPYTLVYADGSKHNYRYDGFTNSAQGNLKEQFGWIEADEMLHVLENFGYDMIDLSRMYDHEKVELYVREMYGDFSNSYIETGKEKFMLINRIEERIKNSSKGHFHYNRNKITKEEAIRILKSC